LYHAEGDNVDEGAMLFHELERVMSGNAFYTYKRISFQAAGWFAIIYGNLSEGRLI
jgi:hypothetical protein